MSILDAERPAHAFPDPAAADHIRHNPTRETLRGLAADDETTTEFGSPAYVSDVRSRSAGRTANAVDDSFGPDDRALVEDAIACLRDADREFVCVDRQVGRHPEVARHCRLFVPREYARIAFAWASLLDPAEGDDPDYVTVQLPDRERTAIRVLPDAGVTCAVGTDYTGEAKKSFLRLFMRDARRAGGLGLHAGTKRLRLVDPDERTVTQAFLGLSGTGKSTLTGHGFDLSAPESAALLQDDVCALLPDGTVAGSEGGGLYVKTLGLSPDEQPEIHSAATHKSAILENAAVDEDGTVDFDDPRYTRNGRAVVRREQLPGAAEEIDAAGVDQFFFITRTPLLPPAAKLDAEQAAAAFVLGESIETSAGDPERAGEAVRVVGTNPFIVGPESAEGNRFYDLLSDLDADCFLLNTGSIGEDGPSVGVEETVTILTAIARDTVEWSHDDRVGLTIPDRVPGMEIGAFYPPDHVPEYDERAAALRAERREYLDGFPDLYASIRRAAY